MYLLQTVTTAKTLGRVLNSEQFFRAHVSQQSTRHSHPPFFTPLLLFFLSLTYFFTGLLPSPHFPGSPSLFPPSLIGPVFLHSLTICMSSTYIYTQTVPRLLYPPPAHLTPLHTCSPCPPPPPTPASCCCWLTVLIYSTLGQLPDHLKQLHELQGRPQEPSLDSNKQSRRLAPLLSYVILKNRIIL